MAGEREADMFAKHDETLLKIKLQLKSIFILMHSFKVSLKKGRLQNGLKDV